MANFDVPKAHKEIGAKPLPEMLLKIAFKNITDFVDVGITPFTLVKPILERIDNPVQVRQIEINSPQIADERDEMAKIWKRLLHRKFPKWSEKKKDLITEDMDWLEIYQALKEEADRANAEAEAALTQKLRGFDKAKEDNQTRIVSSKLLPKMPGRRRGAGGTSSFSFAGGSRTKMTNGKSVLKRARREAVEIGKATSISTPTGSLRVASGQIKKAPEFMLHEHRVANNPTVKIRPPKRKPKVDPEAAKKETRLLAIKNQSPAKTPAVITASAITSKKRAASERDAEVTLPDEDVDNLFGEPQKKRVHPEGSLDTSDAASPKKAGSSSTSGGGVGADSPNKAGLPVSPPKTALAKATPPKKTGVLLGNKRGSGLLSNAHRRANSPSGKGVIRQSVESPPKFNGPVTAKVTVEAPVTTSTASPKQLSDLAVSLHMTLPRTTNGKAIRAPRSKSASRSSRASTSSTASSRAATPSLADSLAAGPASPPQASSSQDGVATLSRPRPPKKKAPVDIFMRPKKVVR